jgi:hypothetical protein
MIEKFTSIKEVISKIYRDLALEDEDRWSDMVEWAAEALEQIGAFGQYVHKSVDIEVDNYRAALPCDFHKLIGVEYNNEALNKLTGNYDTIYRDERHLNNLSSGSNVTNSTRWGNSSVNGYTINDAFLNFNFEKGTIGLAYIGIPTDNDGFPLIPDNISYKEAIEKYIVMKMMYPKFITETINQNTWESVKNDWHWYCSQSRGKANMPSLDEYESIKNMWNRLKPMMNEHRLFFNKLGNVERITRA